VAAALGRYAPGEIGIVASPRMANEDLMAVKRLAERLGVRNVAFRVPPRAAGYEDDFLIRGDKYPNTRGAELIGLEGDAAAVLAAARSGAVKCLWIFSHDVLDSAWPPAKTLAALERVETLVFSGSNANATSAHADWVLPSAAWVERDGTFTNFLGRVQRFRAAVEPIGDGLADWDWIGRILAGLGADVPAARAEHWFRDLARSVPAFAGLTYQGLGDTGGMVAGAEPTAAPTPPGRRAKVKA
jgi:predicted molibdopterin-dependent oxidoreductase YjgC